MIWTVSAPRGSIDTNVDYQYEILEHPDFQSGNTDVEFIERMESEAQQEKRVG